MYTSILAKKQTIARQEHLIAFPVKVRLENGNPCYFINTKTVELLEMCWPNIEFSEGISKLQKDSFLGINPEEIQAFQLDSKYPQSLQVFSLPKVIPNLDADNIERLLSKIDHDDSWAQANPAMIRASLLVIGDIVKSPSFDEFKHSEIMTRLRREGNTFARALYLTNEPETAKYLFSNLSESLLTVNEQKTLSKTLFASLTGTSPVEFNRKMRPDPELAQIANEMLQSIQKKIPLKSFISNDPVSPELRTHLIESLKFLREQLAKGAMYTPQALNMLRGIAPELLTIKSEDLAELFNQTLQKGLSYQADIFEKVIQGTHHSSNETQSKHNDRLRLSDDFKIPDVPRLRPKP